MRKKRDCTDYEKAVAALRCLGPTWCDDRESWINVGRMLYGLGEAGLTLWDVWSRGSGKYKPGECAKKWKGLAPRRGITLASLIHHAMTENRELYLSLLSEAEQGPPPAPDSCPATVATPPPREVDPLLPPGPKWQAAGRALCAECQALLWDKARPAPLAWLLGRGLQKSTIHVAGLGWNPKDRYYEPEAWGLDPWVVKDEETGREWPGRVFVPRGWSIPWDDIDGQLWRVNVRRTNEDLDRQRRRKPKKDPSKYLGPKGFANGLYNGDSLSPERPAVVVEGEFDALTINQEAGDLITAVALGSTQGARRARWIGALAACPRVLVATDAEKAGDEAARWWMQTLDNARRLRPLWGFTDANDMLKGGCDLRLWIAGGLGLQAAAPARGEGRKR